MKPIVSGLIAVVALGGLAACADYPSPPRGPAYAAGWLVRQPPPPPRVELVVTPPGPREQWVWDPGHWAWDGHGYLWDAGRWIERRAGGEWIAAHWDETPNGWRFIEAHWR